MTIKRPKARKKAPSKPKEPQKQLEAPPVALKDSEGATGLIAIGTPPIRLGGGGPTNLVVDYLPMDPDSIYDRLSYQGKMKAKYAAEQRGVTLRTLFEKYPQYREG